VPRGVLAAALGYARAATCSQAGGWVGLVAGRQVDLVVTLISRVGIVSCRVAGGGGQVCGAHREDDRWVPGRGVALPHGIAGLAVHHLQGRLLVRTPRPTSPQNEARYGDQCSMLYSLYCASLRRSRSCVWPHSTKYPLYLLSNERELWTAVTALNINVAYLCASQVCPIERECSLPPPHTVGMGGGAERRGRAGVSARQAPDPTNPPQPAAAPSKPQPRRVRNSHRAPLFSMPPSARVCVCVSLTDRSAVMISGTRLRASGTGSGAISSGRRRTPPWATGSSFEGGGGTTRVMV
jgi:hypothetical protein